MSPLQSLALPPFCADPGSVLLPVSLGARSYPIAIGDLDWAQVVRDLRPQAALAFVVTNSTVGPLYGERLQGALKASFPQVRSLELPDGEAHKSWESFERLHGELARAGADRRTVLFALGGGVVGDLCGFAAATYMRGIPFVQVPTTLLAQVDSSVGGKTGLNLPEGKNLVGAFYQPKAVWADLGVLKTLPARELSAGLAEVIKYGPIADAEFFRWLEVNMERLVARDSAALAVAVRRSCEIKAAVVAADELEGGLRAILNFGHTFGHALETGLGYGCLLHGEAVALGMLMATELAVRLLGADADLVPRLKSLLARAGLPTKAPYLDGDRFLALMRGDKKSDAGTVRYVLVPELGRAVLQPAGDAMALACVTAHSASA